MDTNLGKKQTFLSMMRFALPTVIMNIFTSFYVITDGLFVSNFAGTQALGAVNIVFPVFIILNAFNYMFASGGAALVGVKRGEGNEKKANGVFTAIIIAAIISVIAISALALIFRESLCVFLGAYDEIMEDCMSYMTILLCFAPFSALQILFQMFFITAGKPVVGLSLTICAGLMNVLLDYVFVALLQMGVAGAAYATAIGWLIPSLAGIALFACKKKGLRFAAPSLSVREFFSTCLNGSSEMINNISNSIITFLFNIAALTYIGKNGVAAVTIMFYCEFVVVAFSFGFSVGVAPLFSYNYGARNSGNLKRMFRYCAMFLPAASLVMFLAAYFSAPCLCSIFTSPDNEVYQLSVYGFKLYAICFLFQSTNFFASSLFTAFKNGIVSGGLSCFRTLLATICCILVMPLYLGSDGIWLAIPTAEALTFLPSLICMIVYKNRYGYGKKGLPLTKTAQEQSA